MNSTKFGTRNVLRNKLNAEKLIIKNLIFSDTKDYWDTMSVTETFVKDHLDFFRIFSEASLDLAFSIPWQIVNVPDLRLGKS